MTETVFQKQMLSTSSVSPNSDQQRCEHYAVYLFSYADVVALTLEYALE